MRLHEDHSRFDSPSLHEGQRAVRVDDALQLDPRSMWVGVCHLPGLKLEHLEVHHRHALHGHRLGHDRTQVVEVRRA